MRKHVFNAVIIIESDETRDKARESAQNWIAGREQRRGKGVQWDGIRFALGSREDGYEMPASEGPPAAQVPCAPVEPFMGP